MERFLCEICTQEWNERHDRGLPWASGIAELCARHPEHAELIRAYDKRWEEMISGPIQETVDILDDLRRAGVRLLALSNWSTEKFALSRPKFDFLDWFEAILISGDVGVAKPEEEIFRIFCNRFAVDPRRTVFVDDSERNVGAAQRFGFTAVRYRDPSALRVLLSRLGLL